MLVHAAERSALLPQPALPPPAPCCPAGPPIHHFDLYRLTEGYDLARLDLPASFSQVSWVGGFGWEGGPAQHA